MHKNIREFVSMLEQLEKRGTMYVQPFSYDAVANYLSGFDRGIATSGGQSLLEGFPEWLNRRVGHHCSLHWSQIVRDQFAKGQEKAAIRELFRLFREYLSELPVAASA